jgi:glutathione S-transferase
MPLVVNKFIFGLVPSRAPMLMRPFVKSVTSMLESRLVDPQLKNHATVVNCYSLLHEFTFRLADLLL